MHKDFSALLRQFPAFKVERLARHYRVLDPLTGDFVIASCTCSDKRGLVKLRSDLRRLQRGCGYLGRQLNKRASAQQA